MKINLPESFTMTDKGHYNHDGVVYICEPGFWTIRNNQGDSKIKLNENYEAVGIVNGDEVKEMSESLAVGINISDPRRVLKNFDLVDLSKYGLTGDGYVVYEENEFFHSHKVVQFNSERQFTTYAFFNKNNSWVEFKEQTWVFTIHTD